MKRWGFLGTLIAVFLLSACEDGGHFLFENQPSEYSFKEPEALRYSVFFKSEPMQLAMYEPAQGSFIGMYTDTHPSSDGRVIAAQEAALGVRHAVFIDVMELGGDFPLLWVLECIAEHKMPLIVVLPPEEGDVFFRQGGGDWEDILTEAAKGFAEFPVPMFVVFYPVSADSGWDATTYIAFFRYARAIFAIHAPHVAFVWAVDSELENFLDYFPGNLAVDWVGISLFLSGQEAVLNATALEELLHFYYNFQQHKPIMLNLGISHFSTKDHRYRIAETAEALKQIYRTIQRDFPRVKMLNYMDVCRIDYNGNDYRISVDSGLQAAYRDSVQGFIFQAPYGFDEAMYPQPIRSAYSAFVDAGRVYLDTRILTNELNLPLTSASQWKDGAQRVDAAALGIQVEIDQGHVWLRYKP